MKKRMSVLLLVFIMVTLSACGGASVDTKPTSQAAIEKDVTMLLKGIGDTLDMVKSLGALPEAQVNGNLHYFQNASTEGYFAGFDLGLELESDGKTVKQVYIQSIGEAEITANGLVIGGDIKSAKAVFGEGELSSVENNGAIVNFMIFQDETYVMKTTVKDQRIVAAAFTGTEAVVVPATEPAQAAEGETPVKTQETLVAETTDGPPVTETATTAVVETAVPDEEMAHAFDGLMEFLGRDYAEAEEFLGGAYAWDNDLYGGSAIFEGEFITTTLGENLDTGLATMIMIEYSDPKAVNEPVGMGGFVLGTQAQGDSLSGIPYGNYTLFVLRDGSDQIRGIQAVRATPIPVATVESYQLSIEQFDSYSILSLVYDATGKKVELVNTKGRTDGDEFFDGMDVKIIKAKASKDGRTVYFETDDPKMTSGYGAANNTIFSYDVNTGTEENFCLGFLEDTVKISPYEAYIIFTYYEPKPGGGYYEPYILLSEETTYTFLGTELEADLGDQIRRALNGEIDEYAMAAPTAETIYGKYVDFTKYSAVVVEDYKGINKDNFVDKWSVTNPYYEGETLYPDYFAVFGTIYNVRWEVNVNMDESETYHIADQLTDTFVTYETWRPYDPSIDIFLFEDANGKEYRIVIEDMSDNIDLVMIP